jgi:hypothetical protein
VSELCQYLRTFKGQLNLFLVTTFGAVLLAVLLSYQSHFFYKFVRENQSKKEISSLLEQKKGLIKALELRTTPVASHQLERLYRIWLFGAESEQPTTQDLQFFASLDASWFKNRIERTLISGSNSQKSWAVDLALKSELAEIKDNLIWAHDYLLRVGPSDSANIVLRGIESF